MYNRSAPLRTTLSTNFITCLGIARTVLLQLLHFFGAFRNLEFALNIQQNRPWLHVRSILDGAGAFVCSQVQSSRPSTLCARRMRKVCTEAVHSVALWTQVTWGLGMCKVCTEAVHCVALWTRVTLGLDMCKECTEAVHSVALWTRVTLGLGMCKVCTEAVHCVALWTRVTVGRFGHV